MLAPPTLGMHRQRYSLPEHEKPPPISANSSMPAMPRQIFRTCHCASPPASYAGPATRLRRKGSGRADLRKIARLPAMPQSSGMNDSDVIFFLWPLCRRSPTVRLYK